MNTNVIKHVNMVIIIMFNIWHLTYIKFTLDLPRVRYSYCPKQRAKLNPH